MRQRTHATPSAPARGPDAPASSPRVHQARGNADMAERLAASGQGRKGEDIAMDRGHAAGMLAGFGIAAANALGSGGLPAMLNPNNYWDTMPESTVPALVQPGGGMVRKPL